MNRCRFVEDHQRRHGVKRLCGVLGVLGLSRSSFCYWRRTAAARTARQTAEAGLAARIRRVHQESDGTYGVPRITAELRDEGGPVVNHKRVARVMRTIGLEGVRLRRRHRTTLADQTASKAPDLIGRDFTAVVVNTKRCSSSPWTWPSYQPWTAAWKIASSALASPVDRPGLLSYSRGRGILSPEAGDAPT
ncbi:IS3 family transposase [Streptomyces sp. NBC_00654]|uniref:IS3 family transposase n=1 Tax=Streptomyces sp. NBC_00654 TaxID=2975799 RepID=UPI002253ACC1|nr:IS3 family transposase [Streptomyces sp. NBC_00654]MCX4965446.1 IS3 family transposase [Streptomyces sp. NBC_00654]